MDRRLFYIICAWRWSYSQAHITARDQSKRGGRGQGQKQKASTQRGHQRVDNVQIGFLMNSSLFFFFGFSVGLRGKRIRFLNIYFC